MTILSAKYNNPANTIIKVTVFLNDDCPEDVVFVNTNDIHDVGSMELLQIWEAEGNVIEPFETQAEIDTRLALEASQAAETELEQITKDTITDILGWIASQPNAPQVLKDKAIQASNAKNKIVGGR